MEIQVPLILFTTLLSWSMGVFGSQGILVAKGQGSKIQLPALIAAVVLMAVGGIAVTFHLAQPLHIFNGFGNPTSGITQELIAIVVVFIWMVVFFVMHRRNEGKIPAWCGIVAVVLAVALCIVMAHSYNMAGRPAWNSVLQILSIVGGALVLGPATTAFIGALVGDNADLGLQNVIGSVAGGVLMVVYLVAMNSVGSSLYYLDSYNFDHMFPNAALYTSDTAVVGSFAGDALMPAVLCIVAVVVAIGAAVLGKQKGNWKVMAPVIIVAGFVAVVALRVVFFMNGVAAFNYPL